MNLKGNLSMNTSKKQRKKGQRYSTFSLKFSNLARKNNTEVSKIYFAFKNKFLNVFYKNNTYA